MNPLTFPLLRFIADGRYRTFSEIGVALGVSATEITKTFNELLSMGMDIEHTAGSGCRWKSPVSWRDADKIAHHLGGHVGAFQIEVVDQTGSTNDDLMARARQGAASGLVRVAELQTAGRGRRQRAWHSGIGDALTFSVLWVFAGSPAALSGLSLAVGVSLVRSLRALGIADVTLKWPNDGLRRRRKLGGVPIETSARIPGAVQVVSGIGFNLRLSESMAQRIDQAASDLESAGLHVDRNELLGRLLLELHNVLGIYSRSGFAPFKAEWPLANEYPDKMVRLALADGTHPEGRDVGVEAECPLLLAVGGPTLRLTGETAY